MRVDDGERAEILSRIERLKTLIAELEKTSTRAQTTIHDRMQRELDAAHEAIRVLSTDDRRRRTPPLVSVPAPRKPSRS